MPVEHPAVMMARLLQEKHNLILDNERLRQALREMLKHFDHPKRDEWMNDAAWEQCEHARRLLQQRMPRWHNRPMPHVEGPDLNQAARDREAAREAQELVQALRFIRDIATEEYGYAQVGTGAEVALRHIIRRANDALGD